MWPGLRVRPATLVPFAELRWVLLRAFAPLGVSTTQLRVDSERVVELSRALDLTARVASRHALILASELGPTAARQMAFRRLEVLALDRVLGATMTETIDVARELAIPLVLLKHAALRHAGYVGEGERHARDVDVLVPGDRACDLQRAMLARGFQAGSRAPPFHLPPLTRRAGEVIEVHQSLWGLRLQPDSWGRGIDASALIASGLTTVSSHGAHIPEKAVLAAHAIVHGLVQHRTSPEGYPSMRAISDLIALGVAEGRVEASCARYVERGGDARIVRSAFGLSRALAKGVDVAELDRASPEYELLSHIVASGCDPTYRRALRFERLAELGSLRALQRAARCAVHSRRPANESGAWQRLAPFRVERPVSLAVEFARAAVSYAASRLRPRQR